MSEQLDQNLIRSMSKALGDERQARRDSSLQRSRDRKPLVCKLELLDLSTARGEYDPFPIEYPHRGIWVAKATDGTAEISLAVHGKQKEHLSNAIPMFKNQVVNHEEDVASAYLTWDAQPGKTMLLVVALETHITPGSMISTNAGGVSINEGAACSNRTVPIAAGAATELMDANPDRKVESVVNELGVDVRVGPSGVGATGRLWPAGAELTWKNTSALYVYSTVAGNLYTLLEE